MHAYAEIAVSCPLRQTFDYVIPTNMRLQPGMRVRVPFGRRIVTGIVTKTKAQPSVAMELKEILEKLDDEPIISAELMQLECWASQYYQHPIGEILVGMLPTRLRQGKNVIAYNPPSSALWAPSPAGGRRIQSLLPSLNFQQQHAFEKITAQLEKFNVFLLHGITGSGKTEVYFRVIEEVLQKNQQLLFLIPEISLSPQTLQRFEQRFSTSIAAIHSGLTDKQRLIAWTQAHSGAAQIIIGTRSAIFTPFKNLSLIIIDEEHDPSFKQQTGFRYSARDLAIKHAHTLNIPIILGSATPSAESYHNALKKKYQLLELTQRAGNATPPEFKLIHATPKHLDNGLTTETIQTIQQHIARQEQVLIFINRRGYAPAWFCQSCGWQANCTRCDSHLVLHKKDKKLICHHCGRQENLTQTCLQCHSRSLLALGEGTQRLAESLEQFFPNIPIVRIDRDNVKNKQQLEEQLDHVHRHEACLLVGTQMLAKGHHFPNVTLVVILGIDNGLMSHDFHALERTAQLILQVAGRAGRADKPGTVLLQTLQPQHPQLQLLTQHPYGVFLQTLLKERQQFHLPPFSQMALFRVEAKQKDKALQAISAIQSICRGEGQSLSLAKSLTIYDSVPSPMQRKAGFYHFQLLIQATSRSLLQQFLTKIVPELSNNLSLKTARWTIEVDPLDFF